MNQDKEKKEIRSWCELSEKEAEKEANNPNTKICKCGNYYCFYCYGDRLT